MEPLDFTANNRGRKTRVNCATRGRLALARASHTASAMLSRCALFILVTGCTASAPGFIEPVDDGSGLFDEHLDVAGAGWTSIGLGVEYQRQNTGNAILIAYGGYSAKLAYSAGWATELVDAKLGALGVGQVYAVKGPQDPGYDAREIANTKLRAHLATIDDGVSPIYVVGHSSGSYVAHELLSQLYASDSTSVLSRLAYADLDGGGSGLTTSIIASMRAITFVYAHDPTLSSGYSENSSTAQALGDDYAPKAQTFEVTVPNTGCANGAGWCMHDVNITHRPHNPNMYDLADDYTDFVNRPPTIEYLDTLLPP